MTTPNDTNADDSANTTVYPITTLRDIFNLPTFKQMEVCLDEIKDCMMQARATNDLMIALMAEKGIVVEKACEWPEVMEWKDDGKGEVGTKYVTEDGTEVLELKCIKQES